MYSIEKAGLTIISLSMILTNKYNVEWKPSTKKGHNSLSMPEVVNIGHQIADALCDK